ncbi:MAG: malto-oligosyltrehalose synthase, partial [Pseudonocardia sp.]|nr:malto-oligosyltrehalose synthase [Pseudonocardia sp.]
MRAPSSTYRLQFSKDQTFADVVDLLPYLDALGAGALYASPLLESGAGSNHGYDVVDPTKVSGERGGEAGLRALVDAVRARGLQFVLDIVPNHVGVEVPKANPWWWDVLRLGQGSRYAGYFDIDWSSPILLPVL